MKNRDEGEKKNVTQQSVGCIPLPEVKKFKENGVGGMASIAVAPASAKVSGQRRSGRKSGQQHIRRSNFFKVLLAAGFAEMLFESQFELAQKTAASGSHFHERPPGRQAARLPRQCELADLSPPWVLRRQWGQGQRHSVNEKVSRNVYRLPEFLKMGRRKKPGNTAQYRPALCDFSFSVRISGQPEAVRKEMRGRKRFDPHRPYQPSS
jgi:hypothetical protein